MAETKKKTTAKTSTPSAKQAGDKAAKVAGDVFGKLKGHFEPKKVDEWQKKWLEVPANRKKYDKIADAPEVVGEELTAMTNDIIDFIQGEAGGKSNVFKKIKGSLGGLFKNPVKFVQAQATKGKEMAEKSAKQAKSAPDEAKKTADKSAKSVKKAAKK